MSKTTRALTVGALLIAIDIICARFLFFYTPGNIDRISPQFIPNALAGAFFGPLWATLVCAAGDLLGMFTNPAGLMFNPFFTLSAAIRGLIYGFILGRRAPSVLRCVVAIAIVTAIVDLTLNSIWLALMYDHAFLVTLWAKVPIRLVTIPVYGGALFAVQKSLSTAGLLPGREAGKI